MHGLLIFNCFLIAAGTRHLFSSCLLQGGAGAAGVSCLLVEKGTPGLSFGENELKMGWKSQVR
jgi:hypothetical protein